jgi:predicted RNA binding protein YcfA (HicA-like mRNA interferase family)
MSRRLPSLTPRQAIAALKRAGFTHYRTKGSHYQLVHPADPAILVVVPYHGKALKRPVLRAIIKQAGLTLDQFVDLL